ncbi:MAG: translocation/assembly module TamB domain-containing protein [Deltaproteobacteria bacterium]|jgi:translocation and assembly module TamB|nr:translocation/assembly module TamB domain-containing protein [Deltaproteobacteria bacterium]
MDKPVTLEKGNKHVPEQPAPPRPPRVRRRRLLRTAAKFLGALALLAVLAVAGAVLYLRTDSGARLVVGEVQKALASKGMTLTAATFRGPLPGSLTATGLELSDSEGVFLRIREAEARISLMPLVSRRVQVDMLRVEGADFVRPPLLPPSPEEDGGPMSLPPVDIAARIEIVGSKILSGTDPALAESLVNLDAKLSFDREGPSVAWDMAGSWTGPGGRGITFRTSHDPAERPDEPLQLDLKASAGPGSPLSAFASALPFADPELSVTGSGPLDAWEGDFLLSALPLPPSHPGADDSAAPPAPGSGAGAPGPPAPDAAHPDDVARPPVTPASLAVAGRLAGTAPAAPATRAPGLEAGTLRQASGPLGPPAVDSLPNADAPGPSPAASPPNADASGPPSAASPQAPDASCPDGGPCPAAGAGRPEIRGRLRFSGTAGKTVEELATAPDAPFSLRLEADKDPDFPIPVDIARYLGKTLKLNVSFDKDGRVMAGSARLFSEKGALNLDPLTVSVTDGGVSAVGGGSLEIMDFGEFAAGDGSDAQGSADAPLTAPVAAGVTAPGHAASGPAAEGGPSVAAPSGAASPDAGTSAGSPSASPGVPPLPPGAGSPGPGRPDAGRPLADSRPAGTAPAGTAREAGETAVPAAEAPADGDGRPARAGSGAASPDGEMLGPPAVRADIRYSLELKDGDAHVKSLAVSGDGLDLRLSGSFASASGTGEAASDRSAVLAAEADEAGSGPAGAGAGPAAAGTSGEGSPGGEARASLKLSLAPGSGFARLVHGLVPSVAPGAGMELGADGAYLTGSRTLRDVTVTARTGDLSAFLASLGGDADLTLRASGPVDGDISAGVELASRRILFASGRGDPDPVELVGTDLKIAGRLGGLAGGPSFDGRIELSAQGRLPGEKALRDATLKGGVAFASGEGAMSFRAAGLELSGLGAELRAERLDAELPAEGPPELSGSLALSVTSWELPSKLAGMRISGQPLHAEAKLDGGARPPRYEARLRNGSLAIEGVAKLAGTELSAVATGPLLSPALDLKLTEGPGEAGGFSWSQGTATARSPAPGAPVELSVSFKEKGGRDLVQLSGTYGAQGALARLDTLRFLYPGAKEPLTLRRPATFTRAPGRGPSGPGRLSVDRLELALGKTTLALAGGLMPPDLTVEIREASFSLAKDFGGPELPEGTLSELNARLGPGGSGRFDLRASALLAGDTDRKLRFSAEADGVLEGGRAMAGEIKVTLPSRPRGRQDAGRGARTIGPRSGRGAGAVPASGRRGARAVPASARQAGGGSGEGAGDAAGPAASGTGAAGGTGDSAEAGAGASGTAPDGAGLTEDPTSNAPDLDPVLVKYRFPFAMSGDFPVPDMAGAVQAELKWTGRAESFWRFLGMDDRFLTGAIDIDARLRGTLKNVDAGGTVYLAGAAYVDRALGISLTDINLEGHVAETTNDVSVVLEASDGGKGSVALAGKLVLDAAPTLDVRGQLRHLSPLHRDDVTLTLSGLAHISGPLSGLTISTRAMVEALEVDLNETAGGSSVRTLDIDTGEQKVSAGPRLDISVDIPRGAYVRGRGLDSEWSGNISLGGTAGAMLFSGNLKPVRGYFTFLGKDFAFSGGGISFRNMRRFNPGLDIELTRVVPELTAYLKVRGTLNRPKISFESSPPYPQDEVVSQVLFGKESSQLSRLEALQLANSLMEMTGVGKGMPNPLVTMRDALGLSVLRLGEASGGRNDRHIEGNEFRDNLGLSGDDENASAEGGGSTLEAGKYLSDNIYVGVEQNLTDNTTGVRVEVELSPSISLTGRTTTSSSRIALGWKKDY